MKNTKFIDILIALLGAIIVIIAYYGIEDAEIKSTTIVLALFLEFIFLWMIFKTDKQEEALNCHQEENEGKITELALLNEENKVISTWDMFGKTSLVIGKDIKENHVDINLNHTAYAGMIDIEHAVLNYSSGNWYIEDLCSKNGIVLQKSVDSRKYKLAPDQPCKIDKGDVIIIGLTKLEIR